MEIEVKAPSPGESISEVILANWYKKDGETVRKNETIAEIESEKATLDLIADETGILKTKVAEGETISVGSVVAIIEKTEENFTDKLKQQETDLFTENSSQKTAENLKVEPQEIVKEENSSFMLRGKCFDVIIPSPGESITQVQIGEWLKKDGDFVHKGEEILEIESEKANLSIYADFSGILNIKMKQEEIANVGDIVAVIEEKKNKTTTQDIPSEEEPTTTTQDIPSEEEPTTTTQDIPSEEESTTIEIKQDVQSTTKQIASPAAQKMMEKENIHLEKGSGKEERITKGDVLEAIEKKANLSTENKIQAIKQQEKTIAVETVANKFTTAIPEEKKNTPVVEQNLISRKLAPDFAVHQDREIKEKKLSNIRKRIAERLLYAKQSTAMLTTFNEVNMDAILKVRGKYKDIFQKTYDIKLGFLSFFVKAACLALKEYPEVNSQIDLEKEIQFFFNYVNMGIAVSAPKGLMVPVLRDADKLSVANIEQKIIALAIKARDGKLQVDEMQGGTFTITNGGIFGSMLSTPILNPPQSAILGMHNIVERAVVINGSIEIAKIMYVALSYDHRVIDGKSAVSFLVRIKEYLENPVRMLLEI